MEGAITNGPMPPLDPAVINATGAIADVAHRLLRELKAVSIVVTVAPAHEGGTHYLIASQLPSDVTAAALRAAADQAEKFDVPPTARN